MKGQKPKIICEFGDRNNKSLLIELPQEIVSKITIANKTGEIDVYQFIGVLIDYYMQIEINDGSIDLYSMIFDATLAVDSKRKQK